MEPLTLVKASADRPDRDEGCSYGRLSAKGELQHDGRQPLVLITALTAAVVIGTAGAALASHSYFDGQALANDWQWSSVHTIQGGGVIGPSGSAFVTIQTYLGPGQTPYTSSSYHVATLSHPPQTSEQSRCRWSWGGLTGPDELECWTDH